MLLMVSTACCDETPIPAVTRWDPSLGVEPLSAEAGMR